MYKKILINLYYGGFYNAGFISYSKVKKMEVSEDKEILTNIFEYGIPHSNEAIEDAFTYFHSDEFDADDLLKSNYSTKRDFFKFLKERAEEEDFEFVESIGLSSIYNEDLDEIFVEYMSNIQDLLKGILKKKDLEYGIDEYDFYLKFEECEYDEEKVFKIEAPFKEF